MPTLFQRILENLGLSPKEVQVLGALLQSGSMFASLIAKNANLNRTTTYGILKSLIEKGLVSSSRKGGTIKYQSIDIALLPGYVARKRDQLQESEIQLRELIPQIKLLKEKSQLLPKIQFFEGEEGVKQAYEDTLENNKSKELYDFTGTDAVFRKMGSEWVAYYIKKRTDLGIRCFDIAPDSDRTRSSMGEDKKYLRVTKLLPGEFSFNTEIDIYDNKVAIFSFSQDNPVAVIIEDANIAQTMKTLFRYIDTTIPEKGI